MNFRRLVLAVLGGVGGHRGTGGVVTDHEAWVNSSSAARPSDDSSPADSAGGMPGIFVGRTG
jgi:hypothetical protein